MRPTTSVLTLLAATALAATPALAQQTGTMTVASAATPDSGRDSTTAEKKAEEPNAMNLLVPQLQMQHIRPNDQRGINMFETPKEPGVPFTGFKIGFGAAFTQQFQALGHSNTADSVTKLDASNKPYNANRLIAIGHGPNNAVANLYLNAQLAQGIRVALTGYLSARHHNETWVKDGYLLVDDSPIDWLPAKIVMAFTTIKAGHYEINYGDAHFRRTDNGQAMFNPLVGNYIMDAFTTSVGGEVMLRAGGGFLIGGMTNGEVRGTILNPAKRSPAYLVKGGVDRQVSKDLRLRLSATAFNQARSANQTLYSGDRAGSRYYDVLENSVSTETAQAWSGAINPGLSSEMHAAVINPFLKYRGLEFFGNFERARGRAANEATRRQWNQNVYEGTYRFLNDKLYASARYNPVNGKYQGYTQDAKVERSQFGGGWFITPVILGKAEYVTQKYTDFPTTDIRSGGKFQGWMMEGVIAF
jgi:hypothetical protein